MTDDPVGRLYRTYGPVIYGRCRRLLADDAAAEDATHETFMRVQRHIERAPDGREALTWIYRIATNYCLNELRDRRARPEPRETLPDLPGDGAAIGSWLSQAQSGARTSEDRIADRDLARRLVAAAAAKLRPVAWLYHVDGMDQDEVARVLGMSRRTVVTRLGAFAAGARKFLERSARG